MPARQRGNGRTQASTHREKIQQLTELRAKAMAQIQEQEKLSLQLSEVNEKISKVYERNDKMLRDNRAEIRDQNFDIWKQKILAKRWMMMADIASRKHNNLLKKVEELMQSNEKIKKQNRELIARNTTLDERIEQLVNKNKQFEDGIRSLICGNSAARDDYCKALNSHEHNDPTDSDPEMDSEEYRSLFDSQTAADSAGEYSDIDGDASASFALAYVASKMFNTKRS